MLAVMMIWPHLAILGTSVAVQAQVAGTSYVAVIDFANQSKFGDSMVARLATDATWVELTNTASKFTLASRSQVQQAMSELDLNYPLTLTGVLRVAEKLAVNAVVVGEVKQVMITDKPRQARVELAIRLLDAKTGAPINGAIARGSSAPQPEFTGDDDILVTEAINNAAYVAVKRMVDYIIPEATVLNAMGTSKVLLNRGAQDGLAVGMEMIVSRKDEVIGKIRITEVSNNDATASVVSAVRGVQPEDTAMAIFRLPTVAPGAYGESATRISEGVIGTGRKKSAAGQILGVLLGAALLIALANGHSKGEGVGAAMKPRPAFRRHWRQQVGSPA